MSRDTKPSRHLVGKDSDFLVTAYSCWAGEKESTVSILLQNPETTPCFRIVSYMLICIDIAHENVVCQRDKAYGNSFNARTSSEQMCEMLMNKFIFTTQYGVRRSANRKYFLDLWMSR